MFLKGKNNVKPRPCTYNYYFPTQLSVKLHAFLFNCCWMCFNQVTSNLPGTEHWVEQKVGALTPNSQNLQKQIWKHRY